MADHITDEAVTAMREAADAYYEHDCTRDDECCYRRPDWLGALSVGLAAALPVLNTTTATCEEPMPVEGNAEEVQTCDHPAVPGTDRCPLHDPRHVEYEAARDAEIAELREDNAQKRQRLIELGPIIDTLTHGGVAEELVALRAEVQQLRAQAAQYDASLRGGE